MSEVAAVVLHNELTPSTNKRVYEAKRNGLDFDVYSGWYSEIILQNYAGKLLFLVVNFFLRSYQVVKICLDEGYEVILIHRKFYQIPLVLRFFTWLLQSSGKKIVFDFDDAIFDHWWDDGATEWIVKKADYVTVGSHYLYEWASNYAETAKIIPTSIDIERFSPVQGQERHDFVVGWVGSGPSHFENLEIVQKDIVKFLKHNDNTRFVLVGTFGDERIEKLFSGPKVPKDQIELIDHVPYTDIPKHINKFDVGLMPLIGTKWNSGKCALKALEYMSCGIPAIASNVGENTYVIEHGEHGYLVDEDWIKWLNKIKANSEERKRMGQQARKRVKDEYSIQKYNEEMRQVFRKLQTGRSTAL